MKINSSFLIHESKGEHIMVSTGGTDFSGIVKSNSTAAFIIGCLGSDTTESEIVDRIMEKYSDADRAVVEKDVASIIAKLRSIGAIED